MRAASVLQFKIRQVLQNGLVALHFCEIPKANGLALKMTNFNAWQNLKILRITTYMEQARIRLIVQHANLSSCQQKSKASLRERSILYAYLCLVCLVYIFCMNRVYLD